MSAFLFALFVLNVNAAQSQLRIYAFKVLKAKKSNEYKEHVVAVNNVLVAADGHLVLCVKLSQLSTVSLSFKPHPLAAPGCDLTSWRACVSECRHRDPLAANPNFAGQGCRSSRVQPAAQGSIRPRRERPDNVLEAIHGESHQRAGQRARRHVCAAVIGAGDNRSVADGAEDTARCGQR